MRDPCHACHEPFLKAMQVGVATVSAAVQRAGGSTAHPGDTLDRSLEQRAAFIEGGAGPEAASLGRGTFSLLPNQRASIRFSSTQFQTNVRMGKRILFQCMKGTQRA